MKKLLLTTLAVFALGTAVSSYDSPASADVVYVTVTGTVASGTDTGGLFGISGANLTGDSYTAQYSFDTSLGYTYSSATQNYVYGGTTYGNTTPSPSLGAGLTINGQSFSITGAYFGEIVGYNDGLSSESYAQANSNDSSYIYNYLSGAPGTSPASITTAFSINSIDNQYVVGVFSDYNTSTYLYLMPAVYTESTSLAVPEPASMAILGVGLVALGWVRRKRA